VLLVELPSVLLVGTAIWLGLLFGSFLNVVIYRLPRGMSVATPPSTCPGCGARIRPFDNVPVLSWLWLRGRARCCGVAISARYPAVEALGGLIGWAVMQTLVLSLPETTSLAHASLLFLTYFALALALLAALFIDLEHMILPDELTLGGIALGLVSVPLRGGDWWGALLGGSLGFLGVWLPFIVVYRALRGQAGMGLGDAKLLALAGVWFGWPGAVFVLLAGAVQGTLFALGLFAATGSIEEPAAVARERAELHAELAHLDETERARVLAELGDDVLTSAPKPGLGGARLAFGPFLILALYELLFFGGPIEDALREWLWVA
jgi:leader peptidase (prepilin peptidase) / N-methyltransferase